MEISASEDFYTSYSLTSKHSKTKRLDTEPGTSYEVFRNNTTAVEVVVKEVPNNRTNLVRDQQPDSLCHESIKQLQKEIEDLRNELQCAHNALLMNKEGFRALIFEMKNQMDMTRERETDYQNKNLELILENEKLKTLLETKNSVLEKMRKEYGSFKRLLKYIIKNLSGKAQAGYDPFYFSENEYFEVENEIRKQNKLINALGDPAMVFNANDFVDHFKKL